MDFKELLQMAEKTLELEKRVPAGPWIEGKAGGAVITLAKPPPREDLREFYGDGDLVFESAEPSTRAFVAHIRGAATPMARAAAALAETALRAQDDRNSDALIGMIFRQHLRKL